MSNDMMDDFNVPIPTDDLNKPPQFLLDNGWYETTLQSGAELKDNGKGWSGIRIPFAGFKSKADGKAYDRERRYQVTIKSSNAKAKEIGARQRTEVANAFGLTEDIIDGAGKAAKRLTATSAEEFVSQLNSVAGTPCDVYVTTKERQKDGKPVLKDDGTPVLDNEIASVAPLGQGK